MTRYKVLVVDDDEFVVEDIVTSLDESRFLGDKAFDPDTALNSFRGGGHHIVITDIQMQKSRDDGLVLLGKIKEMAPATAVMIITGEGDLERAIQAMQLGAADFITKPFEMDQLLARLDKIAQRVRLQEENGRLRQELGRKYELTGESPSMQTLKKQVAAIARSASRVLITGPNGSGKELVARAIHAGSARFEMPFVAVNCAAIPENLFESELFGTTRGAFTGAIEKKGAFEIADGGTLFLDEIGDMSLINQGKLLRVLQENELRRVGGEKTIPIDVRVIAATNRDLHARMESGQFREDLFYRLAVALVRTPPLSKCRQDIPMLIGRALVQLGRGERPERYFKADAVAFMQSLPWPGNTRQLINAIENLMIFWDGEPMDAQTLQTMIPQQPHRCPPAVRNSASLKDAVAEFEREQIEKTLGECSSNMAEAASRLGLQRQYLYDKVKKLGIERKPEIGY